MVGAAFFLMTWGMVLSLGAQGGSWRAALLPAALTLLALLVLVKLASAYQGMARYRACKASAAPIAARAMAFMPRLLLAWPRMDAANLRSCLDYFLRRAQAPAPAGQAISFLKHSSYSTAVAIVLICIFVELPLDTMIAGLLTKDAGSQYTVRLVLGAAALYTFCWIWGDRHAMASSYMVIDLQNLHIRLANRFEASIPLSAIVHCERLEQGMQDWCARNEVAREDTLRATPADFPNAVLRLDPAAALMLTSWRLRRQAPACLFVYVDFPATLAAAVQAGQPESVR
ncbi:MAG TPA: hypothetical protein VGC21_01495 [Telluria sp.]